MTSVIEKDIFYIDSVPAQSGSSLKAAVLATLNVLPTYFKPYSQWTLQEGYWLSCGWAGNTEFLMQIKKVSSSSACGYIQLYNDFYTITYNFTTNSLSMYKASMTAE